METILPAEGIEAHPLRAGSILRIPVQHGSTLFVRHGRILFRTPPYWLADTMLAPCMHLDAEDAQLIEIAGWLEVTALEAAEVLLISPQPGTGWLATARRALQLAVRRIWRKSFIGGATMHGSRSMTKRFPG